MSYIFWLLFAVVPKTIRIDEGTETGTMATIHCYLHDQHRDFDNPVDSVLYGPSTQNKIEWWWGELHHRMEQFFKQQLAILVENGDYDSNITDRYN